jgi:hypothetical protein
MTSPKPVTAAPSLDRAKSDVDFLDRLQRHNPRDASHDLLVLCRLLQVVLRLQSNPEFRSAAKQAGDLQAHDSGQRPPLRQNVMDHLARYAEGLRNGRSGQASLGKDVFPDNLPRMYGRQSVSFSSLVTFLMVIFKVDINRAFARPAERDAIVSGNADGPSPRFALQAVEPVPCHVHFLRLLRNLKRSQAIEVCERTS